MNTPNAQLTLLVVFAEDFEKSAAFYESLGIEFERHSHPPCGEHYASLGDGCLFEIYRRREGQPFAPMTFGFNVTSVEDTVRQVIAIGGKIKRQPHTTDWGVSATLIDPDGNSVLVTEKRPRHTDESEVAG